MLPTVPDNLNPVTRGRTRMVQSGLRHLSPDERAQLLQEGASELRDNPGKAWGSDWARAAIPALTGTALASHLLSKRLGMTMPQVMTQRGIATSLGNAEIMTGIERILESQYGFDRGQELAAQYRQRLSERAAELIPGLKDPIPFGEQLLESRVPPPTQPKASVEHIIRTLEGERSAGFLSPEREAQLFKKLESDPPFAGRWRLRGAPEAELIEMGMSPKTRTEVYNLVRGAIQGGESAGEMALQELESRAVKGMQALHYLDKVKRLASYGVLNKSLPVLAPLAALYGAVKATQAGKGYESTAGADVEKVKASLRRQDEARDVEATKNPAFSAVSQFAHAIVPDFLGF